MDEIKVRVATRADLPRLTEIYNHYVVSTPITFDLEPLTVETRTPWFEEHSDHGRYRLLVAQDGTQVLGYANTHRFRTKAAYDTTVESTIYCAPEGRGRGIGAKLYGELFDAIAGEDINRIVAGITLPNTASLALHQRFGFRRIGTYTEVGRKFGKYWDVAWYQKEIA